MGPGIVSRQAAASPPADRGGGERFARSSFAVLREAKWAVCFWLIGATSIAAIVSLALVPRCQTFDSNAAREVRLVGKNTYEARFGIKLPAVRHVRFRRADLRLAGSINEVERSSGCYWLDREQGIVLWSLPEHSKHSANDPTWVELETPGWLPNSLGDAWLALLVPAVALGLCGLGAAIDNRRNRNASHDNRNATLFDRLNAPFDFDAPSPIRQRLCLLAVTATVLAFALVPGWNRLATGPDSNDFLLHLARRTPLVPTWIDLFDSQRGEPRTGGVAHSEPSVNYWGPGHRYVNAIRAWKLLFAASVCVFVWCLSSVVPWWFVGALVLAGGSFDADASGMTHLLDEVLSEPLSYALVFLLLSALVAYLRRPGWTWGILIAVLVNGLILARPASIAFISVFGCIWLFHLQGGIGLATRRACLLALVTVCGILLHCTANYATHGHFHQHAFTGLNLMTTTLQLAEPSDADAFSDPRLRLLVRKCTIDYAAKRRTGLYDDVAGNINCWRIASPVFAEIYGATVVEQPYLADDVLSTVAKTLIRRHPAQFVRLAWSNFRHGFWITLLHLPLVVQIVLGLRLFFRTGDWRHLFVAFLAALPFLCIVPACLTNYPISRYRSMVRFAEIWSPFLFAGVLLTQSEKLSELFATELRIGSQLRARFRPQRLMTALR